MSSEDELSIVATNFPISQHLILEKSTNEDFQLIGYRGHELYISSVNRSQLEGKDENNLCNFNELVTKGTIVNVFKYEEIWHAIDTDGILYKIRKEEINDEYESDLFDDSPKGTKRWEITQVTKIINTGKILASCEIEDGVASVVQESNDISVKIDLFSKQISKKNLIHRYEGPVKDHNCLMTFIKESEMNKEFIRFWFPDDLEGSGGLIFAVLPETIVCGIFINDLKPHFIFSWPFQAVHVAWKFLSLQGSESNYLVIVFNGGNIVALGPYGKHILHYPMNTTKNCFIAQNTIFTTDYSDLFSTTLSEKCESVMHQIKGAVGFCQFSNSNVLISTRHRTFYNLNITKKESSSKFKMPQLSIIDDILKSSEYLEELLDKIESYDKYINALSCSLYSNNFKFKFNVQVVSIMGYKHTFRLCLETLTPGINFGCDTWHLAVSLSSSDFNSCVVQELQCNFYYEKPLEQFFHLEIKNFDRFFELDVSLISFLSSGKYRPLVNIGKINLNITYFIQPISSYQIHKINVLKDLDLNNLLKYKKEETLHSVEVSLSQKLSSGFFQKIFNNSKALWRASEWTSLGEKTKIEALICGRQTFIELRDTSIEIKCNQIYICYQLKFVIIAALGGTTKISANEDILMEIENILKTLEILEYRDDFDVDFLIRLFERKKKYVSGLLFHI